jgi:cytochrome c-type biogenesis protein CcmH/NrfG
VRRKLSVGLGIGLMLVVIGFYAVTIGYKGVALIHTGSLVGVLLGLALLVVPVLGVLLVLREVQFGRDTARLARSLEDTGGLPVDDLPRRPSGRVDRAAADAMFERMRVETEANPEDWRAWYRLALAYDAAGDRTRARAAARHAIALHG